MKIPSAKSSRESLVGGPLSGRGAELNLPQPKAATETTVTWRRTVLHRVLVASVWAVAFTMLVDLAQAMQVGDYRFVIPGAVALVGVSALTFAQRIPFKLRAVGFVITMVAAVTTTLLDNAFLAPNGFVIAAVVTCILALSVGKRAAWATWALFTLALLAVAVFYGVTKHQVNAEVFDPTLTSNWVRVILSFSIATAICIVSVSYLTDKLEGAVNHSAELLNALKQEGENRIQALKRESELEKQLRQSEELENLGRLAGGVAHDFNNLLVVIINNAELLKRTSPASTHRELQAIEDAGNRAAALTQKLLTFGNKHEERRAALLFNSALKSSVELVSRLLPSNIEFSFRAGESVGYVIASQVDVEQLVLNLCVNARDAMLDGGSLLVETSLVERAAPKRLDSPQQKFACLRVKDSGSGISEENQKKVFDAFFSTHAADNGTGLGLNVVKRVVDAAGGFIELDSALGEGTEFRVYLQVADGPSAPESEAEISSLPRGGEERILLVDDIEEVREVMSVVLEGAGYEVVSCRDGEEALTTFLKEPDSYSLVLTDVIMPKMTGKELYDAIQPKRPSLPFVFCTGYSSDVLPVDFFNDKSRVLITKPFVKKELLSAVRNLLDPTSG